MTRNSRHNKTGDKQKGQVIKGVVINKRDSWWSRQETACPIVTVT